VSDSNALVLVIAPGLGPDDVERLSARLRAELRRRPAVRTDCDVAALTAPTLATIDVLARLQRRARALGAPLRLVGAPARLRELVELAGLAAVLPAAER